MEGKKKRMGKREVEREQRENKETIVVGRGREWGRKEGRKCIRSTEELLLLSIDNLTL